jgi:hypothetical protein
VRFAVPPHAADILAEVDGRRSIADIHQALAGKLDDLKRWADFKLAFERVYERFNKLNRLFLAQAGTLQ